MTLLVSNYNVILMGIQMVNVDVQREIRAVKQLLNNTRFHLNQITYHNLERIVIKLRDVMDMGNYVMLMVYGEIVRRVKNPSSVLPTRIVSTNVTLAHRVLNKMVISIVMTYVIKKLTAYHLF